MFTKERNDIRQDVHLRHTRHEVRLRESKFCPILDLVAEG